MFTTDAISLLTAFFSGLSSLLAITIPGTSISFMSFGIGLLVTYFVIFLAKSFIGSTFGFASRGGNSRRRSRKEASNHD